MFWFTVQLGPNLEKENVGTVVMATNNVVDDHSQQHLQLDTEEIHEDLHYTIIEDKSASGASTLCPVSALLLCLCSIRLLVQ